MTRFFLELFLIAVAYSVIWFLISLIKKRNDIADVGWGLGFIVYSFYLLVSYPLSDLAKTLICLVVIWALRLSGYIFVRNRNKREDFRYQNWRKEWGRDFYWRSFLQVFFLQTLLIIVVMSPVLASVYLTDDSWSWITTVGILVWLFGFLYETVADMQLYFFIKGRKTSHEIMKTGLWKYCRHPNYFGEILVWWGIYICVLPLEYGVFFVIGPVTITCLVLFVSGVPMLEKKYENHQEYQLYKRNTPVIFPRWWK